MKLIVGLGNPGKEYQRTRHNIGFDILDKYAQLHGNQFEKKKFEGKYYETIIDETKVIFLKPQKYMNLSGEVVRDFVHYFKISTSDVFIICDDLDMETGKIRLRKSGRSGGHNGLKNIEFYLNTIHYKRLKIGISNDKQIETKDYVLGKFSKEDQILIDHSIEKACEIIDDYFQMNFDCLMNKYN